MSSNLRDCFPFFSINYKINLHQNLKKKKKKKKGEEHKKVGFENLMDGKE